MKFLERYEVDSLGTAVVNGSVVCPGWWVDEWMNECESLIVWWLMGKPKYFKIYVLTKLMQYIPTKGGLFKQTELINSLMFGISTVESSDFAVKSVICCTTYYMCYTKEGCFRTF